MSKHKPKPMITDVLRAAVAESKLTQYRIAVGAGIDPAAFTRFVRGDQTLRGDKLDQLAAYLGYMLIKDPNAVLPEPTPENLARPTLAKKVKRKAKRKKRKTATPSDSIVKK